MVFSIMTHHVHINVISIQPI